MDDDATEQAGKGALLDLIEVERRLEAEVASAREEAKRIVETARDEVRSVTEDGAALLETEIQKLRDAVDRDCEATLRDLRDRTRADEERYRSVDDAKLQELARWVAAQVVETESPS